jgi:hypothetical protein
MADKIKLDDDRLMGLKNEIQMSVKFNEKELLPILDECLSRYTGTYIPPFASNWDIVVNEIYPVVQSYMPSIFFRTPRALLKPKQKTYIAKRRDPVSGEMIDMQLDSAKSATTQEAILNYSIAEEIDYKNEVRKVLLDGLVYLYGVLWHGYKGNFGMTEEQSFMISNDKVFVKRISPMRFIHDPAVTIMNIEEGQWIGRVIDVPLIDLIEDDKLDVDKKLIKGYQGYGTNIGNKVNSLTGKRLSDLQIKQGNDISSPSKSLLDYTDNEFQKSNRSKFVQVYEIFLRPTKKEAREGSKGKIILLTDEQVKPLRVNNWTVKAEGFPAKVLFFNEVPDSLLPLADIDTYKSIADQKNVIFNIQLRNAQENSKVWIGLAKDGADEEDIEAVRQGENTIVRFETDDVRKRMMVASPGGTASSELYIIDQRIQRNLEDKSGISDLRRGFLQSGEESATSVKIREAGGAVRIAYRQDIMTEFLKSSFKYINQLNRQFKSVEDAVRIVGNLDIDWVDNISREELLADVDVDINVFSMLPENPEKEVRNLNTILALMVNAMTNPTIMTKLQTEGKTMNLSPLIESILLRLKIKEPDLFRNIKPEESMGFVSVQQLKQAQANAQAAIQGAEIPFPPQVTDDHRVKLETYSSVLGLVNAMGQTSDMLEQLIQIHQLLIQQLQEKGTNPPQQQNIKLKKPTLETL